MLLESLVTPKKDLTIVTESLTLAEALEILEASNNRCVPILDKIINYLGEIFTVCIFTATSPVMETCIYRLLTY